MSGTGRENGGESGTERLMGLLRRTLRAVLEGVVLVEVPRRGTRFGRSLRRPLRAILVRVRSRLERGRSSERRSPARPPDVDGGKAVLALLRGLRTATCALLQARFVVSELQLRDVLDELEALALASDAGKGDWTRVSDVLAVGWQESNARWTACWREIFVGLELAWRGAGLRLGDSGGAVPKNVVAGEFLEVWVLEWDRVERGLGTLISDVRDVFEQAAALGDATMPETDPVWIAASRRVCETVLAARSTLWEAWSKAGRELGTSVASVSTSDTVRADWEQGFERSFERISDCLEGAIRDSVEKMCAGWVAGVQLLIQKRARQV